MVSLRVLTVFEIDDEFKCRRRRQADNRDQDRINQAGPMTILALVGSTGWLPLRPGIRPQGRRASAEHRR